jgi:hypothetical protein
MPVRTKAETMTPSPSRIPKEVTPPPIFTARRGFAKATRRMKPK